VNGGKITAKVTGSRAAPYEIRIELTALGESVWKQAITNMAEKAQFSAELLAGQMPLAIDDAFRSTGASLFPIRRADLKTSCSCPDWGDPCKHVAAAHYVLGEALDRDPFLLFELRGKTKASVLDALRTARGGAGTVAGAQGGAGIVAGAQGGAGIVAGARRQAKNVNAAASHDVPTVTLGKLKAAEYDQPREALPVLHFSFEQPVKHGAVLRQLGVPAAWQGDTSPAELLEPLVRAAAETARRIAMAEPTDVTESEDSTSQRRAVKAKPTGRNAKAKPTGRNAKTKPTGRNAKTKPTGRNAKTKPSNVAEPPLSTPKRGRPVGKRAAKGRSIE
jgi:uncharacterized Zn finger protein